MKTQPRIESINGSQLVKIWFNEDCCAIGNRETKETLCLCEFTKSGLSDIFNPGEEVFLKVKENKIIQIFEKDKADMIINI